MSLLLALTKDPGYPVFKFCKENGIECTHDFNTRLGISWTEVYHGDELVLQVDSKATVEDFLRIVWALYEDFSTEHIDDDTDVWVAANNKRAFKKLVKKYHNIFKIE